MRRNPLSWGSTLTLPVNTSTLQPTENESRWCSEPRKRLAGVNPLFIKTNSSFCTSTPPLTPCICAGCILQSHFVLHIRDFTRWQTLSMTLPTSSSQMSQMVWDRHPDIQWEQNWPKEYAVVQQLNTAPSVQINILLWLVQNTTILKTLSEAVLFCWIIYDPESSENEQHTLQRCNSYSVETVHIVFSKLIA